LWGRRAATDLKAVERIALPAQPVLLKMPDTLNAVIRRRVEYLTAYQHADYAREYELFVDKVRQVEAALGQGERLTRAVATSLFKLMAYKDEYEVARLYTDRAFMQKLKQQLDGKLRLSFNFAPPLFSSKDTQGHPQKKTYGSWVWPALHLLARMKGLRGTRLDIFGWTAERRMERNLIVEYRDMIASLLTTLDTRRLPVAAELASLPEKIRGFGHVKALAVERYRSEVELGLRRLAEVDASGQEEMVHAA
jgi:indolepyruvate ferredoxin oxidoreductase